MKLIITKSKRILFFVIVLTAISSSAVLAGNGLNVADTALYLKNPLYLRYVELFKISKMKNADIVMLGNSLTQGANWGELLGRHRVANRGIASDVLEGYLNRIEYVTNLKPKICFIEGGINDIYNWTPVETIFEEYVELIGILKSHNIKPVIQSTLYTGKKWGAEWLETHRPGVKPETVNAERNREVKYLNSKLIRYAKKNKIDYIDLNKVMTKNSFLRPELTWDGAHLRAKGYKIWAAEINKILIKYGL